MSSPDATILDSQTLRGVLGDAASELIGLIASHAQAKDLRLFLVGGSVRDILLGLPTQDLDFALEADASHFARQLASRYGGAVQPHKDFGTAIWTLDSSVAARLNVPADQLPAHIDFARARSETYAEPAALPTVQPATIQADLRRRDFSLNALALQLSPASAASQLIDECGGLADLKSGLIRVLHADSFIDDPTRIFRAIKLGARLGFTIESHTHTLMRAALPYLERVSGARLAHELGLILDESQAAAVLLRLQALGALKAIHPAFCLHPEIDTHFVRLSEFEPKSMPASDRNKAAWCVLLAATSEYAAEICARLDLPKAATRAITACAGLLGQADSLRDANALPSQITRMLDGTPQSAIVSAQLVLADDPVARDNLSNYLSEWRQQKPGISGHDLMRLGLPTGPRYKEILDALRFAWIDGQVKSEADEQALLKELLSRNK